VRSSIWQVASRWGEKAPKSNQQRRLHLGDRTIGQFRDLLPATGSDPNHFVFSHRGGPQPYLPEPMTRSFRRVTTALEASTGEAWSFRFHDLRHFTATELFRQGHSARTVANRLGHADVAVTLRTYAHDTDDQARRAADEIERGL
jgi:integrase